MHMIYSKTDEVKCGERDGGGCIKRSTYVGLDRTGNLLGAMLQMLAAGNDGRRFLTVRTTCWRSDGE